MKQKGKVMAKKTKHSKRPLAAWTIDKIEHYSGRFHVTVSCGEQSITFSLLGEQLIRYEAFQAAILNQEGFLLRFPKVEKSKKSVVWLDLIQSKLRKGPPESTGAIGASPGPA